MKVTPCTNPLSYGQLSTGLFLMLGLFLLWQSRRAPIGDFANYYYASRLWVGGQFTDEIYEPYIFNRIANQLSPEKVFVNFTPVPPVSILAYAPFALITGARLSRMVFGLLGLLLFCRAFQQLVRQLDLDSRRWLLLLPLICLFPLLNNFHQGQSYLLLLALLIEGFRQWQQSKIITAALLWSIPIALKLFPIILLLFLLIEKDFRSFGLTLSFSIALSLLPILFFSPDITTTYFLDIVPRLFRGEINDPFAILYQSGRALLLNAFVEDLHLNPRPAVANLPRVASLGQLLLQAVVLLAIALLMQEKKEKLTSGPQIPQAAFSRYALALLSGLLLTGYGSSYSLMLLVLPALALPALTEKPAWQRIGWILLAIAGNVPIYLLRDLPLPLQFPRLYALLAFLALLFWAIRPVARPATLGVITLVFTGKGLLGPPLFPTEAAYYLPDGHYGIIYDYVPQKRGLELQHFNEQGSHQSNFLTLDSIRFSPELKAEGGQIFWKGQQLTHSRSLKRQPALLNEQYILYLSDEGRGVGFYTLRKIQYPWRTSDR